MKLNALDEMGTRIRDLEQQNGWLREALQKMADHYADICKSNPGWMGKMCLQNYALWNEALLAMDNALCLPMLSETTKPE